MSAVLVAVLLLVSACSSDSGVPRAPGSPGGIYPGAAVLAGDAPAVAGVAFVPSLARAPRDVPVYWKRCHAPGPQTTVLRCVLGDRTAKAKKVIVLVGDSATGAWMAPLDKIGKARHWKIVTMLHSLCTWTAAMTVHLLMGRGPYKACHTWGINAQHLLLRMKPDVVISTDRPKVRTPTHIKVGTASSRDVGLGMATYWRQLMAHHIPVVAIRETPEPGRDIPKCLAAHSIRACSTRRAAAIAAITPVTVADRAVHRRETLFDLNNLMCSKTMCPPVVGNVVVYRDIHHMTKTFSLTLVPYLQRDLLKVPALARR